MPSALANHLTRRSAWPFCTISPEESIASLSSRGAARQLPPAAPFILSTWQFITSERLRKRLAPWEAAGIHPEDVEPDDYLVGWGEGSPGARYCAYIDEPALKSMAAEAGLSVSETYFSDGHEGDLNLYAILAAKGPSAR